jgi:hypothetical protein
MLVGSIDLLNVAVMTALCATPVSLFAGRVLLMVGAITSADMLKPMVWFAVTAARV